jgi:hypothetical protein
MSLPQRLVVLSTDLMDRSRFDPVRGRGVEVVLVRRAADVGARLAAGEGDSAGDSAGDGDGDGDGRVVLVVDLARPDALEAIGVGVAAAVDVVAYGSHVDRVQLDQAHAVGARVLARSAFFARITDLLD